MQKEPKKDVKLSVNKKECLRVFPEYFGLDRDRKLAILMTFQRWVEKELSELPK